jgi:hypothetical protein
MPMIASRGGAWWRRVLPAIALVALVGALPGGAEAQWGCPNDCSGNGTCEFEGVFNRERQGWPWSRVCACDSGWTSADCSLCSSSDACAGRKVCRFGACRCPIGWQGDECDKCYSSVACGEHGSCFEEACVCEPGWSGRECDVPLDRGAR